MLKVHANHYRSYGDYSVTTLLNPPRIVHLGKRHERKQNYDNMFASFIGTGVHAYAEHCLRMSPEPYELERTVMDKIEDRIITGTFDIMTKDNEIYDIKTCKTWKLIFDPEMEEWHEQQNIYRYLLHLRGIEVPAMYIQAVFLDWIESKALRDKGYPQQPDPVFQLTLWPHEKTAEFLVNKINLMKSYENTPDDDLPECTPKERFEDPLVFACFKSDAAKSSSRNLNTLDEAVAYMKSTKGFGVGSYIEVRRGIRKRCEKYCEVNQHCRFYHSYMAAKADNNLHETIPYEQV